MSRQKTPERRRTILDAARELFGTQGYHCTNIADIAEKLGMGHGTFYRYFKSKRDIFQQVLNDITGRIMAVAITENPSAANDLETYRGQVERIARALFDLFGEDSATARVFFFEAQGVDEEMRVSIDNAFKVMQQFTARYLENGVSKGFLKKDLDVEVISRAINAISFEAIRQTIAAPTPKAKRQEAERWARGTIVLMFEGIAAAAP